MKLSFEDTVLLEELCSQYEVNFDKVKKLLDTVESYEFQENTSDIYDSLKDILKD